MDGANRHVGVDRSARAGKRSCRTPAWRSSSGVGFRVPSAAALRVRDIDRGTLFRAPRRPSAVPRGGEGISLDEVEGWSAKRRSLVHALRRVRPETAGRAPPGAPLRHFSIPGRAFREWHRHPDQPAPGRETLMSPGRSPGPPRCKVTSLARRKPHPTPLAQRLMRTPSVGWDVRNIVLREKECQAPLGRLSG
jgi:hypothetical protein